MCPSIPPNACSGSDAWGRAKKNHKIERCRNAVGPRKQPQLWESRSGWQLERTFTPFRRITALLPRSQPRAYWTAPTLWHGTADGQMPSRFTPRLSISSKSQREPSKALYAAISQLPPDESVSLRSNILRVREALQLPAAQDPETKAPPSDSSGWLRDRL